MSDLLSILQVSLFFALMATLINILPALGVGYLLARGDFPGKNLLHGLVNLPMVMPPVTVGYLLLLLLGRKGLIGGFLYEYLGWNIAFTPIAGVLASAVVSFPLLVRGIRTALEMSDPRLEKAAATMGAPPLSVFFRITLPSILPGLTGGLALGFARALGEFGATMTFAGNIPGETRTMALAVYSNLQVPGKEMQAVVLVGISVVVSLIAMVVSGMGQEKKHVAIRS